jgi:hypothetical protein
LLIGRGKLLPEGHKFDYLKPSDAFTLKPAVKAKADKSLPPPLN